MLCPPYHAQPDSDETRVRVERLEKIMAKVWPCSGAGEGGVPALTARLMSMARFNKASTSSVGKSLSVRKWRGALPDDDAALREPLGGLANSEAGRSPSNFARDREMNDICGLVSSDDRRIARFVRGLGPAVASARPPVHIALAEWRTPSTFPCSSSVSRPADHPLTTQLAWHRPQQPLCPLPEP